MVALSNNKLADVTMCLFQLQNQQQKTANLFLDAPSVEPVSFYDCLFWADPIVRSGPLLLIAASRVGDLVRDCKWVRVQVQNSLGFHSRFEFRF